MNTEQPRQSQQPETSQQPGHDAPATNPGTLNLVGVVLDSPDPGRLAQFYARLLGVQAHVEDETWAKLDPQTGSTHLSFQLEPDYVRPVWPTAAGEPQIGAHLDFQVTDVDAAERWAAECGATKADVQPQDDCKVWLDPDGHPFCLFLH